VDDKYPIQLVTDKIASRISHAMRSPEVSGLLFCRCRVTLNNPKLALYPHKVRNPFGDIYFELKAWFQIWIHQLLRAKVLRYLFTHLPDHIPSAKAMDELKTTYRSWLSTGYLSPKRTSQSLERAQRGVITQNCYESMLASGIKLPEWFQHPNGEYITLGKLYAALWYGTNY
jgi:hypothetical protein